MWTCVFLQQVGTNCMQLLQFTALAACGGCTGENARIEINV